LWIMSVADRKSIRFGGDKATSSSPEWSPDGQSIAYSGMLGDKSGLIVARIDGSNPRLLARLAGTNSPLPWTGKSIAGSPDGKRIAFVTATPGPESQDATGDPVV